MLRVPNVIFTEYVADSTKRRIARPVLEVVALLPETGSSVKSTSMATMLFAG
jgi:hypothetical protein